jgi:hypothetical protein
VTLALSMLACADAILDAEGVVAVELELALEPEFALGLEAEPVAERAEPAACEAAVVVGVVVVGVRLVGVPAVGLGVVGARVVGVVVVGVRVVGVGVVGVVVVVTVSETNSGPLGPTGMLAPVAVPEDAEVVPF